ncbi:MAG: SAM-dependent methyltransferase [Tissierellia bacterium]|nr:SAM-dependent methyltransferase [Tissierellia bacterium]
MDLSNRLLEITKFVPKGSVVADIGTDHGYIPVYLVEKEISERVIASDISPASLEKTVEYVNRMKLQDKIQTRVGDGLKVLKPAEVDTVIIAGMGGILISNILEESREVTDTIDTFILQPMVASYELRKYLTANGFKIVEESLAKEGRRLYEIIIVKRGEEIIAKDIYYEIGPRLIEKKHPLLKDFIAWKKQEVEDIIRKLEEASIERVRDRYEDMKKKIAEYEEVERKIEGS